MTSTTLLLILDAGRADYASSNAAPFLRRLARASRVGETESPPGFAQRTAMFTGTYPDTSGNFSAFGYAPERSPFRWVQNLGFLRKLHRPRKLLFPARVAIRLVTRRLTGAYHTDPAWIPATFLPFFEMVEDTRPIFDEGALPSTSIFDLCRLHGRRFRYAAHPVSGDDEATERLLLRDIRAHSPTDLYVAQFSALDEGGHHHGPLLPGRAADGQTPRDLAFMEEALARVDRRVEAVVQALDEAYDDVNVLLVGDHGMAPVRRRVDVAAELAATGLVPGEDYVLFVDSTFAKIWFETPRAARRIPETLAGADYGRLLEPDERKRLRIAFAGRRYGDAMFAADPGVLFWPDYFHVVEHTIKGMHGYVDKRDETYGALLLRTPAGAGALGRRSLVDVFPTLCDLLGLPIPATSEGETLLRERAADARTPA